MYEPDPEAEDEPEIDLDVLALLDDEEAAHAARLLELARLDDDSWMYGDE